MIGGSTHPVANSVRNWEAVSLIWQGRWEEAERLATEYARVAENMRSLLLLAACRAAVGFSRWTQTGTPTACNNCATRCNGWKGGAFNSTRRFISVGWPRPARPKAMSKMRGVTQPMCCAARARASGWGKQQRFARWRDGCAPVSDFVRGERWLKRAETSASTARFAARNGLEPGCARANPCATGTGRGRQPADDASRLGTARARHALARRAGGSVR